MDESTAEFDRLVEWTQENETSADLEQEEAEKLAALAWANGERELARWYDCENNHDDYRRNGPHAEHWEEQLFKCGACGYDGSSSVGMVNG